jgi:ribosomal protein S27AE
MGIRTLIDGVFAPDTVDVCASCGTEDYLTDVGCVSNKFQACRRCVKKYGYDRLKIGFDLLVSQGINAKGHARWTSKLRKCFHCGDPVLDLANGKTPMFCGKCGEELRALRSKVGDGSTPEGGKMITPLGTGE